MCVEHLLALGILVINKTGKNPAIREQLVEWRKTLTNYETSTTVNCNACHKGMTRFLSLKKLRKKSLWIGLIGWIGLVASYYQGRDSVGFFFVSFYM